MSQTCEVKMDDGVICGRQVRAAGLCEMHYARKHRGAPMGAPVRGDSRWPKRTCSVEIDGMPCGLPVKGRGMCEKHYQRAWKQEREGAATTPRCQAVFFDGQRCDRPADTRGLCSTHYQRALKGRDLTAPFMARAKRGSNPSKTCATPGCERSVRCRGYCDACYQRVRQAVPGFVLGKRGVAVCEVDDCERLVQSRGLCNMHYQRLQNSGDPGEGAPRRLFGATDEERLWPKVEKTNTCWLWTGACDSSGYGSFKGSECKAHRMAYALVVGPIPDGMALHHTCGVRHCVNPAHLVPVTARENTIESLRAKALEAQNATLRQRIAELETDA